MHLPNLVFICFCPSFTPAFIINKTRPFYNRQNPRNDKRKTAEPISSMFPAAFSRAIDGARTRGLDLGKVARYQLRHYRICKYLLLRAIDGARTRGLDLGKVARYQLRHYRICKLSREHRKDNNRYMLFCQPLFEFFIHFEKFIPMGSLKLNA